MQRSVFAAAKQPRHSIKSPTQTDTSHSRNGRYGISAAAVASVCLDVGRPDHLAPLLGFVGDELSEVGGRARKHRAAQIGEPRLHLGIGEAGIDLLVELLDDLGGRVLGRADA